MISFIFGFVVGGLVATAVYIIYPTIFHAIEDFFYKFRS